jgi:hypothetical protein
MANKGLQNYTVVEAQNITLGQGGITYFSSTSNKYTPPTGQKIIAIQFLENTVLDATNTTADTAWATRSQVGPGTNGEAFGGATFLAGMTVYGRWDTLGIDSGSIIIYLG